MLQNTKEIDIEVGGEAIVKGMFALFEKQINANALLQIGAFLGFVSGFFKHTIRAKTDKK